MSSRHVRASVGSKRGQRWGQTTEDAQAAGGLRRLWSKRFSEGPVEASSPAAFLEPLRRLSPAIQAGHSGGAMIGTSIHQAVWTIHNTGESSV
ncbi:unnamed protein product [Rangifer tarandus platyrhynchus]|uniref:Uncharacterized protein n=3 Tax=Rangifer tarandus platyrhynchus TaxID=3082113 RepID=A0ABN8Y6U4_RANTA|nr:unnamed protein product [Rangifer tarandus platyrhynchus]CAI9695315.1 unnamed protein product [Rangifer tarandus platyrhynchus]